MAEAVQLCKLNLHSGMETVLSIPQTKLIQTLYESGLVAGGLLETALCCNMFPLELQTKVREDITITENTPTKAFSWLNAPTSNFTKHY